MLFCICLPLPVCQHQLITMFPFSRFFALVFFTHSYLNCIVQKGFRHLEKKNEGGSDPLVTDG